jgi:hypothetical protein
VKRSETRNQLSPLDTATSLTGQPEPSTAAYSPRIEFCQHPRLIIEIDSVSEISGFVLNINTTDNDHKPNNPKLFAHSDIIFVSCEPNVKRADFQMKE